MTATTKHTAHDKIETLIEGALLCFQQISRKYFLFHLGFTLLVLCEILLIGFFFTPLIDSYFMGISIALLFFTLLLYFILRLYYHEQKPEELAQLRDEFLSTCKGFIPHPENIPEHHLALASACCRITKQLQNSEGIFSPLPGRLSLLSPIVEKYSLRIHLADVHYMKELFLLASIHEHVKLIKCEPTSLEAHAATANAYVMLSSLYTSPGSLKKIFSYRQLKDLQRKHRQSIECALEEFKILGEYAPSDPWVHEQLAASFHSLNMPQQEIKEYETILQLKPNDLDTLYKLGMLYFCQGENAKGLKIYQQLKENDLHRAEELLQHYGAVKK